jgi:hypothetical protein
MKEYFVVHYRNGYLAYDSHSGGYPCETSFEHAHKFTNLSEAIHKSNSENWCNGVSRCTVNVTKVLETEVQSELRTLALSKLTPEEKQALGIKE